MIVSVTLHLIIVPVIIPMVVCLHHLMIIRAAIVRAVLRNDQRRGQCGHRDSRQGKYRGFPKLPAHIAFLVQGLRIRCYGCPKQATIPRYCQVVSAPTYACRAESTHPTGC
jgi:hypothetical protein